MQAGNEASARRAATMRSASQSIVSLGNGHCDLHLDLAHELTMRANKTMIRHSMSRQVGNGRLAQVLQR